MKLLKKIAVYVFWLAIGFGGIAFLMATPVAYLLVHKRPFCAFFYFVVTMGIALGITEHIKERR